MAEPSSSATGDAKPINPRTTVMNGSRSNNINEIRKGLQATTSSKDRDYLLSWAVDRAIKNSQIPILKYLLDEEGASLNNPDARNVANNPSVELFQLLLDHGWDINTDLRSNITLLYAVCDDEALVHWCLDHGAQVKGDGSPPLLEMVAGLTTPTIFKLLSERGAGMGPRTLHKAASGDDRHLAMVRYLVEEVGLDVNAMDTTGQLPGHYGTPLAYAVQASNGSTREEIVRHLLEKGADPTIKDCHGLKDPISRAEVLGKDCKIAKLLREWATSSEVR